MTWARYLRQNYKTDFERFHTRLDGYKTLMMICDANPGHLRQRIESANLHDPVRFTIELFLEATLAAGVHCYDFTNYQSYVKKLGVAVFVEAHGWGGVHRPHVVLSVVPFWGATELSLLTSACAELLPAWARAYDAIGGRGRGKYVLRCLAEDGDMRRRPYDLLNDEVIDTYLSGFASAAS